MIKCRPLAFVVLCALQLFAHSARAQDTSIEAKTVSEPTNAEAATVSEPKNKELAAIFRYPLFLRLHGGVGFAQRAREQDGLSFAAVGGLQLMLPANANQSFGVEVDYVQANARPERRYVAAGLFVENRLFDWFLLSIGLMAYVPLVEPRPTPIGISTKLGWAPNYHRTINPFAVLRADWIFDDRIVGMLSADFGISISLRSRRGKTWRGS